MKFNGLVGPAYTLPSINVDFQRAVNIYPEVIESGAGKEANKLYYRSTPGLVQELEVGTGPIRLIHPMQMTQADPLLPANRVLIVSGSELYGATFNGTTWSTSKVGNLGNLPSGDLRTSAGPISCVNGGLYVDPSLFGKGFFAVLTDGLRAYHYTLRSFGGFLFENLLENPTSFLIPSAVVLIDGFYIYNTVDSGQFYVSDWNDPAAVSNLSFASSEGDPDNIVAMIALKRYLWLFNERSTEIWANTGNADFPFERIQGGFIEKGCVAGPSVAKIEGNVFWLGRDAAGEGQVFTASGINAQRISTHAIESAIAGYADISTARAYTYQSQGHSFYILTFSEATWVYDLSTGMWHERAYTNAGVLERHRGICGAFFPEYSKQLVGDHTSGKVYSFSETTYTDNLNPITRMRVTPHISASQNRTFHKRLILDMETGVGLDGDVQGSDPQVMLDFSNDGGHTWSSEMWASAGKKVGGIGDFKKRVIWNRLGSARDRVYRIKMTDPVPFTLIGAELDVEVGGS